MFHKNKMPKELNDITSILKYTILVLICIGIALITAPVLQNTIPNEFHMSKSVFAMALAPIATISATVGIYAELNSNDSISKFKLPLFSYEIIYFVIGMFTLSALLLTIQPKLFHSSTQIMTTESTILMALVGIQIIFIQFYRLFSNELPDSAGLFFGIIPYAINVMLLFTINAKSVYPQFDILGDTSMLMLIPAIVSLMILFVPSATVNTTKLEHEIAPL